MKQPPPGPSAIPLFIKVHELVDEGCLSPGIVQLIAKKFQCRDCNSDFFLDEFALENHKDWKERRDTHRHLNENSLIEYCPYCYDVRFSEPMPQNGWEDLEVIEQEVGYNSINYWINKKRLRAFPWGVIDEDCGPGEYLIRGRKECGLKKAWMATCVDALLKMDIDIDNLTEGQSRKVFENIRRMFTSLNYNKVEKRDAGIAAICEAYYDGEISNDGAMTIGAKRFIRRRMVMAGAPPNTYAKVPKIDYGYQDGRMMPQRGIRVPAHDKWSRYRQRNMARGLCTNCGKQPETEKVMCNSCTEKYNERRRRLRVKKTEERYLDSFN